MLKQKVFEDGIIRTYFPFLFTKENGLAVLPKACVRFFFLLGSGMSMLLQRGAIVSRFFERLDRFACSALVSSIVQGCLLPVPLCFVTFNGSSSKDFEKFDTERESVFWWNSDENIGAKERYERPSSCSRFFVLLVKLTMCPKEHYRIVETKGGEVGDNSKKAKVGALDKWRHWARRHSSEALSSSGYERTG